MIQRFLKRLRKIFGTGQTVSPDLRETFAGQTKSFRQAQWGIRIVYGLQCYVALRTVPQWEAMTAREGALHLWPVSWMQLFPESAAIQVVLVFLLVGSLAAVLVPQYRWARITAFLALFQFIAWHNSYGKIGHSLHVLLFIIFILMFLPDQWNRKNVSRAIRQKTLFAYWSAQAVPLIAYSMAGLVKIGCAILQISKGETSVFSFEGLPRHVADRLLQTGAETPMGPWVIENPLLVTPLMWGTLYLEVFAFWALFRPATRIWFVGGLVAFHVASYFTMTIWFPENCFLLILLMLIFPATTQRSPLALSSLRELPVISYLLSARKGGMNSQ